MALRKVPMRVGAVLTCLDGVRLLYRLRKFNRITRNKGISLYWKMMQKYIVSDVTSMLMEYSYLMDLADECEDPYMRSVYASSFFITIYYACRRTWKPFNPILGETYEMVNHGGVKFIAEQVSHHPPMSAGHAENDHFVSDMTSKVKTKFLGNSLDIYTLGRTWVTLKRDGVVLDLVPPPSKVHNLIFGRTWVDVPGEMIVTNMTKLCYIFNLVAGSALLVYIYKIHPSKLMKSTKGRALISSIILSGVLGSLFSFLVFGCSSGRFEVDGYVYNAAEEPKILMTGTWNESMR
ncbi:hypothetical protein ACSBR1_035513 [Camellia fascicularis]